MEYYYKSYKLTENEYDKLMNLRRKFHEAGLEIKEFTDMLNFKHLTNKFKKGKTK